MKPQFFHRLLGTQRFVILKEETNSDDCPTLCVVYRCDGKVWLGSWRNDWQFKIEIPANVTKKPIDLKIGAQNEI